MDPDAALERLRDLRKAYDLADHDGKGKEWLAENGAEMIDLITELDNWMRHGGFPPAAWERG